MRAKTKVAFYKGEDGAAVEARFMKIHEQFSKINTYTDEEIALVVFEGLRDASKRAIEAGRIWGEKARAKELEEDLKSRAGKQLFKDPALQAKYEELEELKNTCGKPYLIHKILADEVRMIEEEYKRNLEAAKNENATDLNDVDAFYKQLSERLPC